IINSADALAAQTNNQAGHLEIETGLSANQESNAHNTETLQLLFSDNGPGIASAHLGNVFDPFFSTKEPGKGTGLGLYVSFMIVEGLGGRLEAISTEGHGTTMKILLPIHNSMNTD
ncbi:MAG: ATP-binding protein, partial [Desulfobacterales bacterium]|nr:ATP-binding protein [Desulfobacterales bacterium]